MKESEILRIFRNGEDMHERLFVPLEKSKIKREADEVYNKLEETLSKEQFDLFNDFIDKGYDIKYEDVEKYFMEGFKIGLRIAVECLTE